jgi:flagellin-like hook-associated protein FlgL
MLSIGQGGLSGRSLLSLNRSQRLLQKSFARLSSGSRVDSAIDDAAGTAVSSKLTAAIARMRASASNLQNAMSFLQMQDSALSSIGEVLKRMGELKVLSTDPTKNDSDKANYQTEFAQLQEQVANISDTKFNGIRLFAPELDHETLTAVTNDSGSDALDLTQFALKGDEHFWMSSNKTRYTFVSGSFSWNEANTDAQSHFGHLATVENDDRWSEIVSQLGPDAAKRAWLGAYQASGTEPSDGWTWVTGEPVSNSRWKAGGPDDVGVIGDGTVLGGVISGVAITDGGSGFATPPALTFSGGGGTGAAGTATLTLGVITGVTITSAGSGYTSEPTVDAAGYGPIGQATVVGGPVTGVTITDGGADFTTPPTLAFSGGGGSGAAGTAIISGGVITGVTMTSGGSGYLTAPTVQVVHGSQNYMEINGAGGSGEWDDVPETSAASEGYILERSGGSLADVSLGTIENSLQFIATCRATNGANQSRLQLTSENLATNTQNLEVANSRIADVDVASEMVQMMRSRILVESASTMLQQGIASEQIILRLLGSA